MPLFSLFLSLSLSFPFIFALKTGNMPPRLNNDDDAAVAAAAAAIVKVLAPKKLVILIFNYKKKLNCKFINFIIMLKVKNKLCYDIDC